MHKRTNKSCPVFYRTSSPSGPMQKKYFASQPLAKRQDDLQHPHITVPAQSPLLPSPTYQVSDLVFFYSYPSQQVPSLYFTVFFLIQLLNSLLDGFFAPRTIVFSGGLLSFLGFLSASFSVSFPHLLISVIITAAGSGLCDSNSFVCLNQWTEKYRPLAIGIGSCGGN